MNSIYEIHTDLDPQQLTIIGKTIFVKWLQFALGQGDLGGHRLKQPSGKYASSITMRHLGPDLISISADNSEAESIEFGHKPIDMLKYLLPGKVYPIHGSSGKASRNPKIWAKRRVLRGAAITPMTPSKRNAVNTSGTGPGWTIPAMPAYSPAKILTDLYQNYKQEQGI